jgi:hypothetical protein
MAEVACTHLDQIEVKPPPIGEVEGCEECLKTGGHWVHLRVCLSCGKIGCCDSSPNRHAPSTLARPITRSCVRWNRARTGAGAMRTRPASSSTLAATDDGPNALIHGRGAGLSLTGAIHVKSCGQCRRLSRAVCF